MQIYQVHGIRELGHRLVGVLITPDSVTRNAAVAAWSYAVRYTAKGIDLPDYDTARKMLLERHPSWQFFIGEINPMMYDSKLADQDKPDV